MGHPGAPGPLPLPHRRAARGRDARHLTPGTYGGIRATFHHLIESEAYYLGLLSGSKPDWYREEDDEPPPSMEELQRRAADMEERWEAFLAGAPIDPAKPIVYEDWSSDAGVLITQVLNHGASTVPRSPRC